MGYNEAELTRRIKLWCGENDAICLHVNVGGGELKRGGWFTTGLPKGFPDLHIIGNGFVFYCETKIKPRKPTKEQIAWIKRLRSRNIVAGVAYTLDEFIDLFNEAKQGCS